MAVTPEEYIATLDEPRRSDIESLDDLIHTTLPELERVHASGMIGYGPSITATPRAAKAIRSCSR